MTDPNSEDFTEAVAVIGMAGRFPGARDLDQFWRNLRDGVESVRYFTDEEMMASGISPALIGSPSLVKAGSILDDVELFDAAFFGFSPREAEVLDPQQRIFLECAWEALERAGYAVDDYDGWIGLFAGISLSSYLWKNLVSNPQLMAAIGDFQAVLFNDRDYFTTRVSYKLNLKGPSINVQTACSTSLVAVHLACQSLLSYQSTLALAGGIRVNFPQKMGYAWQEGGIFSPDGHCRAFDAKGAGALFGEGVGVIVLKRLSEALADGDTIHAVIKGSAINNDGSLKVGYTAPSVDGQAEAITLAHAVAGVDPETITYVEAHGSGTPLGDPIEVAALTHAFRAGTDRTGFCGLGSVKTNVGHLEAAAGIAGFIKTVLALENRTLPPSLHFQTPNPRIDFASSPFYVHTETREWSVPDGVPRRAGVSSFGMGGTNVHAVLEEAPEPGPAEASRPWQLLVLSARTETALEAATDRLATWLEAHPEQGLGDVAWTLQAGRRAFDFRRALVCRGTEDAVKALAKREPRRLFGGIKEPGDRPVVWMLSGLGEHHARMGEGLYRDEPSFREEVDRCAGLLRPLLGVDLREVLYPGGVREEDPEEGGFDLKRLLGRGSAPAGPGRLAETWLAQPALFVIEVALARLWRERGVEPAALVGYSLGEYAAAHLAGVMPLETTLRVVAERARMIQQLPAGAMLAVPLPEEEAVRRLEADLSLAAVNGPAFSVMAGPVEAVTDLEARLATEGLTTRRLETSHAFHSRMMDPIAPQLAEVLRRADLRPPEVPLISNVTGTWMTAEEATDPEYWARHLRQPVRFGAGLEELRRDPARLLLEVGPGQALATLVLQHPGAASSPVPVFRSMRHPHESRADSAMLLEALGKLWLAGVKVDWTGVHTGERRRRVPLPTYPFERQRFFIEARPAPAGVALPADTSGAKIPPEDRGPKPSPGLGQHARPNLKTVFVAPRNELEEGIAAIWRELLGLREVGVHDGFFELGGNSLVAPQLVLAMRDRFGVDLPVAALFDLPTVGDLAGAVERIHQEGTAAVLGQQKPVDLRAEVALDPEIAALAESNLPVADWRNPRAVVLTGSTGFLGAFLLRDLLEATVARVFCPARADSAEEAGERVRRNLESRGLWKEGYADRIVPLAADLGQPLWGLSEEDFGRLAKEADAVYHCGAWVNFLYPYRVLKPINVQGTMEALRLASRERVKAVHFVSSVSAISFRVFAGGGWAYEDQELVHTEGLFGGYGESKWVAEQIVKLAQDRGIPATIHRPGVVSGDSLTGAGNTRDMIWNMMKGCIQLGIAPERDFPIDVTPVDYVSRAIVHLSLCPDSIGHAFHYPNPAPMRWIAALPFLRSRGYWIETISHRQWQRTAAEVAPRIPDSALLPFLPLLAPPQTLEQEARLSELELPPPPAAVDPLEPRYDAANTEAGLAGSGIDCPPVDEALLNTYLDYFLRIGWLPEPGKIEKVVGVEEAVTP